MNLKAKKIGLKNTFFADPTGLSAQNVSTVNDLMTLAKYILKNYPEIAQITTIKNYELDNLGKITNTNQLLTDVPEIIFSKTGFTNYANGCLLIAINNLENNNYLINIILGADDRFLEMKKLINWKNISDNNK
jgi:D-alanyl-D-alanine carboxypeptidase